MRPARARQTLARVLPLLRREYGPRPYRPGGSAVGELVGTILSQNTSGANASAGFRQLWRRFRCFSGVADAPVGEIEKCIRVAGLSRIKAPRIRRILRQIRVRGGGRQVSLEFLRPMPVEEATRYLLGFNGVGAKTAACVLLFAFGRRVFPVDTHILRIAQRLGVLAAGTSAEKAQEILTPLIRPAGRYEMHVLLITHGRRTCRARNPRCELCPLLKMCRYGRRASGGAGTSTISKAHG